ncbi:SNase-domain-containing protein [Trichocladium antarcticum]|uniref:Probable endonuclease LCL3 n=1 Tax=Trichocladium antarcticum TaxID=1450529 RepID=A0AAN6ZBE1_9PEZI|nr:SNase-domain-containing protein [Trichocladium antarcticum]
MTGTDQPRRTSTKPNEASWFDSWRDDIQAHLREPNNWIAPVAAAGLSLGLWTFYQSFLRRIPASDHIAPSFFRRRSLLGKVTSVGDGDGFHLFHTPGGRLAGWGWLRRVPKDRKALKGRTISIRIAGVDAPEGAHFGKPAQPHAAEALAYLDSYLRHRRVRAYLYKRDQYERVVATVYVRKPPFFFPRKDVGMELIRRGLAVTYEGKTGAEFGGAKMEARYKAAEAAARRKGKGLWAGEKGGLLGGRREVETPMAFKRRMKALDEKKAGG